LDFERSLIIGELDSENEQLRKIRSRLSLLRIQEQRLSGVFEEWQKVAALKIDEVEERILNAEDELRRLQKAYQHSKNSDEILADEIAGSNDDTLRSDELLERIKYQQELVDLERKTFEDMEFHQMEEEAHKQTEREELLKEICELEKEVKKHETQLSELEEQQKKILENVRKDTNTLEKQRQRVIKELEKEKMRLCEIESKLNKLSKIPSSSDDTDDFVSHYSNLQDYSNSLLNDSYHQKAPNGFNGISHQGLSSPSTYSFSDDDDFTPFGENIIDGHPSSNETNHELEQSLKRLASPVKHKVEGDDKP
jgi:chromosome segregation ATPase